MALAVSPIPPEAESTRGGKHQSSTSLMHWKWLELNVLQCIKRESAVVYLAKEVPWDYGNLYPKKRLPWKSISLGALHHCLVQWRRRNSPFRSFKHTGSVDGFQEYKRQRNLGTTAIRHTKTSFLNQLHHAGTKAFWMIIKSLSKQSSNIPTLSCDDSLATSDYDKANCLNNQFYNNLFIPPLSIIPQQGYTNPVDCPNVLLCTEDEAFELILGLECTKSTGPDEISARMLNH